MIFHGNVVYQPQGHDIEAQLGIDDGRESRPNRVGIGFVV
jgi:hypothetical protein